jgi:hypothetical protein
MAGKFVVKYPDGRYYRDRDRRPRFFLHNATKLTERKALDVAQQTGGVVLPVPTGPIPLGQ